MAYRSVVHEVTDYTPARLMLGRELRLPVDLVTGRPPDQSLPTVTTSYPLALQESLSEVHRQVRDIFQMAGQAMKQYYDRRMREASYSAGDVVWLYNTRRKRGLSPKLQSPWEGSYKMVDAVSNVIYRICRGHRGCKLVVHVDRLWRYHGPGYYTWGRGEANKTEEEGRQDGREPAVTEPQTVGHQPTSDVGLTGRRDGEYTSATVPSPSLDAGQRGAIPKRRRQEPRQFWGM
ncbi:uncharacterized protein LOC135093868 isoform X2 [Scylla paramamosain]|uniref:uncharacterized protein LOC135093868 isoform X2 n=1 Tax=Scylla paramamosain TaxID=85552 RepID=UPI00308371D4